MTSNDTDLIPKRVRDYLYPVATALIVLLGGYGVVSDTEAPLWISLAAALLGVGTATAYRPSRTLGGESDNTDESA